MIPIKIKDYFEIIKNNEKNETIEGELSCCDSSFEVHIDGEVKCRLFSRYYLYSENNKLILNCFCKKCSNEINVFDSRCDGYDNCLKKKKDVFKTKPFVCIKCKSNDFKVKIKYEYTDINELDKLRKKEKDNAFSWIWISLECNKCGKKYKNFVDLETC